VPVVGGSLLAALVIGATLQRALGGPSWRDGLGGGVLVLLIFTFPGALVVSGVFAWARQRAVPVATAYLVAGGAGVLLGALVLLPLGIVAGAGAAAGLVTSLCWAGLHRATARR
jgi:hypothetical protein